MLPPVVLPSIHYNDVFDDGIKLQGVAAVQMARRNNLLSHVPMSETPHTNTGTAIAAAGLINVWSVSASRFPIVFGILAGASVAGRYALLYNGVAIVNFRLPANQSVMVPIPAFGAYYSPVAAVFQFQNNTAGAADLDCTIWGAEVTA